MTIRYLQLLIVLVVCLGLLGAIYPLKRSAPEIPKERLERGTVVATQLGIMRGAVKRNVSAAKVTVQEALTRRLAYVTPPTDPFVAYTPPQVVPVAGTGTETAVAPAPVPVKPVEPPKPKETWPALKLLGIVKAGDQSLASISGVVYRVGDTLRSNPRIKVAEITDTAVILVSQLSGERVELRIEGRQPKRKANE
jgi:hypothetical protein